MVRMIDTDRGNLLTMHQSVHVPRRNIYAFSTKALLFFLSQKFGETMAIRRSLFWSVVCLTAFIFATTAWPSREKAEGEEAAQHGHKILESTKDKLKHGLGLDSDSATREEASKSAQVFLIESKLLFICIIRIYGIHGEICDFCIMSIHPIDQL